MVSSTCFVNVEIVVVVHPVVVLSIVVYLYALPPYFFSISSCFCLMMK